MGIGEGSSPGAFFTNDWGPAGGLVTLSVYVDVPQWVGSERDLNGGYSGWAEFTVPVPPDLSGPGGSAGTASSYIPYMNHEQLATMAQTMTGLPFRGINVCGGGLFGYGGRGVDFAEVAHAGVYGIANYDTQSGFSLGIIGEAGSYLSGGYEKAFNFKSGSWQSEGLGFAGGDYGGVLGTNTGSVGFYAGGEYFGGGAYLNLAYKGACQ
jgi:hypothetical protein